MKKKFSLNVLVYVIGGILLLTGVVYLLSADLTGNTVAPNSARCVDTDGGQAIDLAGRCIQYSGGRGKIVSISEDKCLDTKRLVEYYCNKIGPLSAPTCVGQVVTCPNGCGVYQDGSVCK